MEIEESIIRYSSENEHIEGYLAYPKGGNRYSGIVLIHEIFGLDNHIKDVTERLAREGYAAALKKAGIKLIAPSEKEKKRVTDVILHAMGGKIVKEDKNVLISAIRKMKVEGAEAVIIGCTELSLVLKAEESPIKAYDTLDILAEETLKEAY